MDKQRVIEIARQAEEYAASQTNDPFDLMRIRDEKFAAAILLEAADICQQVSEGNDTSAEYCQYRLEQVAKDLTE